ncbi:MAG TPA: TetR family transcriptional regulator C-terminal domain-containing protein [Cyclobacteriaceae bacterium]
MEATKKSRNTRGAKASGGTADKIRSAYVEYLLTNSKQPPSVYKFCLDLGIKEEAFYSDFGSFDAIDKKIWTSFITKTVTALQSDKAFATFTSREKILSFYYALLEQLKHSRSFVLQQTGTFRKPELSIIPSFLKGFKQVFDEFVTTALDHGKANGEIGSRPYLDKIYPQLFWMHFGFILLYWRDDDSAGFEKTDAAVEKSVNLAFDLIGKGAIDSAFDFAKFLYQSKR